MWRHFSIVANTNILQQMKQMTWWSPGINASTWWSGDDDEPVPPPVAAELDGDATLRGHPPPAVVTAAVVLDKKNNMHVFLAHEAFAPSHFLPVDDFFVPVRLGQSISRRLFAGRGGRQALNGSVPRRVRGWSQALVFAGGTRPWAAASGQRGTDTLAG